MDLLKSGRKPKVTAINQLFLYLVWLQNGFTLQHLSWLFDIWIPAASRYIITWTNFLYFKLRNVPIWPTQEQVNEYMPKSFRWAYPSTRCIIDCTELYGQRPSSLSTQSTLYLHYKSHVTYKGLIGISPSRSVTFISQLFDGSISDTEIVSRSGFLKPSLWNSQDSVMADQEFVIYDELKELGVVLNIPCFLAGRDQLTAAEVKESQSIASVHIHVERAIQRVKKFRVLRNEIPRSFHGSVNQIWTVCCMLCNFMTPLIQKDMESGWFILNNVGPYTELVSLINHFSISEKLYLAENTVFLKSSPLPRQKITGRSSRPEMSVKKGLLKIPLNLQENTRDSLF